MTLPTARAMQVRRVLPWVSPLSVAAGIADNDGALCLLSDPEVPGSRSFVAASPDRVLVVEITETALFSTLKTDEWSGGGVVGLASYDAGARAATGPRPHVWPDLMLARYPAIAVFDHDAALLTVTGWGETEAAADAACDDAEIWIARAISPLTSDTPAHEIVPDAPAQTYLDAVTEVVDRIGDGELFQANIARGWSGFLNEDGDPFEVFLRLTRAQGETARAAPYGAFWRVGDRALVSNSPELFLACNSATGRIETRPIKGTRPRDADPATDAANAAELLASVKDRAENLMIVDLMRNDLARVCQPGSVAVECLFEIDSHPTVHHLVSTVTGVLNPDIGSAEVLEATFPPGSITGAPKHQAMKVIAELEPPRGAWCGSLFLIDEVGDLTASVLIRTATFGKSNNRWTFRTQAGAGIVADSDPQAELQETEAKIRALREALTGYA